MEFQTVKTQCHRSESHALILSTLLEEEKKMRKFCCILIVIICSQAFAKERLCQSYEVQNDVVAFTVPENKEFVLLLLHVIGDNMWQIDVNDSMFLMGYQRDANPSTQLQFPDDTAVIGPGKTLTLKSLAGTTYYTMVGYYRDINPLAGDLDNNGFVNFADFAVLANNWLKDGT